MLDLNFINPGSILNYEPKVTTSALNYVGGECIFIFLTIKEY